jgi:hypothetical protein
MTASWPSEFPWLDSIAITRLRFFYTSGSKGCVDWFLGPEIRGGIGRILKFSQGCIQDNNEDCQKCLEKTGCIYIKNFDRGGHKPKCFHLKTGPSFRSMKTRFPAGETLQFDMVCFGHTLREIRKILLSLHASPLMLGSKGLTFFCRESGCVNPDGGFIPVTDMEQINADFIFQPASVFPGGNDPRPDSASSIRFEIHTPAEISYKKQTFLQNPAQLSFETLVRKMMGRTEDVAKHLFNFQWNSSCGSLQEFKKEILHHAKEVELDRETINARWQPVPRRNKQDKKFGGLVGNFVYKGHLTPYLGLLNAISLLGLGKNTISGFGHCSYHIVQP